MITDGEWVVREYFKDSPILVKIAKCESGYRHFDSKGEVIRGKVNSKDIGIMQINAFYHEDTAKRLGLDIYSYSDNLMYAKWLYEKEGSDPWVHSSKCWKA